MLIGSSIYLFTCLVFFLVIIKGEKYPKSVLFKLFLVSFIWWVALIYYFFDNKEEEVAE